MHYVAFDSVKKQIQANFFPMPPDRPHRHRLNIHNSKYRFA